MSKPPQKLTSPFAAENWCHTYMQAKTFSFKWTIHNFSYCRQKKGEFLESSPFPDVNNQEPKWSLMMYPRGFQAVQDVNVCLKLVSCNKPSVDATAKIFILDAQQGKKNSITFNGEWRRFARGQAEFFHEFPTLSYLLDEANAILTDDTLTLFCEVTSVVDSDCTAGRNRAAINVHVPELKLSDDLSSLFESKNLSDVVLVCDDGQEFAAHKSILAARSPVFAAMFGHDMKEKEQNRVEIRDMEPQVLQGMLRCMYSGRALDIINMAEDLLVAADRYALDSLKSLCEEHISSNLTTDQAVKVLILADRCSADHLKANVIDFIRKATTDVVMTDGWKSLVQNHPRLISKIFRAPETEKLPCP